MNNQSKTPLTDSKVRYDSLFPHPRHTEFVLASDSRAIELRLNECVEALELLAAEWDRWNCGQPPHSYAKRERATQALTNARKSFLF
jgi:hypothetical protein